MIVVCRVASLFVISWRRWSNGFPFSCKPIRATNHQANGDRFIKPHSFGVGQLIGFIAAILDAFGQVHAGRVLAKVVNLYPIIFVFVFHSRFVVRAVAPPTGNLSSCQLGARQLGAIKPLASPTGSILSPLSALGPW